ncbi:MAG: DUF4336 domain-containing protein, partial [Cyanobacteria bacterium Co-bin13]|nr:DUF4336 domain-containing protein [Cyanobacteria bacterium Co-bin13]
FQPGCLKTVQLGQAMRETVKAPDHSAKAYFGLFPFKWEADWEASFHALRGNGRPFIAPILQTLILDQDPQAVAAWAERVARWEFEQIISAHFDAPIETNAYEFAQAFAALQHPPEAAIFGSQSQPLLTADVDFIRKLEETLDRRGITSPPKAISSGK